jgi:hypothetical protein
MSKQSGLDFSQIPDAFKMSLAVREPQTQAVISRPAAAGVAQEARYSQVGSGRQGTAGAGRHEQDFTGRYLSRKPDAFKLAGAGREPQARAVISKKAGSEFTQDARRSQVGSGGKGTADAGSYVPLRQG